MRHADCRALAAFWDGARSGRAEATAPPPPLAQALLRYGFLARRIDADHYVFEMAGAEISALHGRELAEHNALALWRGRDRELARVVFETALERAQPFAVLSSGRPLTGPDVLFEVFGCPLSSVSGAVDRVIGLLRPLDAASGARPIVEHKIFGAFPPLPVDEPPLAPPYAAHFAAALLSAARAAAASSRLR